MTSSAAPAVTTRSWVMTLQLSGADPETVTVRGTTVLAPSVTHRQALALILGDARQAAVSRATLPARHCPDHPAAVLQPLPGGGARGTCPVDSRSYQMSPVEVTA
jgi:hypothetical protein